MYGIVDIDESLYADVLRNISNISSSISSASSFVSAAFGCLSGELASAVGGNSLSASISALDAGVSDLSVKINAGLEAYKMIEDDCLNSLIIFDELIGQIFNMDGIVAEQYNMMSLEEKTQFLTDMLSNFQQYYDVLLEEFIRIYGNGIEVDEEVFEQLYPILISFDIFSMIDIPPVVTMDSTDDGRMVIDPNAASKIVQFCDSTGILDMIGAYLNGASWEEAGLADFYNGTFSEEAFLDKVNYSSFDLLMFDNVDDAKNYLLDFYNNTKGYYEKLRIDSADYIKRCAELSYYASQIDSLTETLEILDYEKYRDDPEYTKFLETYNSDSKQFIKEVAPTLLPYISDDERAMYNYLCSIGKEKEAEQYFRTLQNTFIKRIKNDIGYFNTTTAFTYGFGEEMLLGATMNTLMGGLHGVCRFAEGIADTVSALAGGAWAILDSNTTFNDVGTYIATDHSGMFIDGIYNLVDSTGYYNDTSALLCGGLFVRDGAIYSILNETTYYALLLTGGTVCSGGSYASVAGQLGRASAIGIGEFAETMQSECAAYIENGERITWDKYLNAISYSTVKGVAGGGLYVYAGNLANDGKEGLALATKMGKSFVDTGMDMAYGKIDINDPEALKQAVADTLYDAIGTFVAEKGASFLTGNAEFLNNIFGDSHAAMNESVGEEYGNIVSMLYDEMAEGISLATS